MKQFTVILLAASLAGACSSGPIQGTWQYDGGVYNGTPRPPATDFRMVRTYTSDAYEGLLIEGNTETRYTAGTYEIRNDSVYLTSTFSNQPSQLLGRSQAYRFRIENSRLTISGFLPNGMQVEEYWKKIK
ncbi:MAG TPA: hypothetical protein VGE15_12775 [Sphingobacteriaceae bacterium]